jgi:hypothetical protein
MQQCHFGPLSREPGSHRAREDDGGLCVEDWAEIRRLHRGEKMPIKVIARVLGCSKNTVNAALAAEGPPKYSRRPAGSIVDTVEPRIRELLAAYPTIAPQAFAGTCVAVSRGKRATNRR